MDNTSGLRLRVAQPIFRDTSKGQCRLHPATMAELGLTSGDAVLVSDEQNSVGIYAYSSEETDWNVPNRSESTINIGFSTLTGKGSGEVGDKEVLVRPCFPSSAKRVVYQEFPEGTAPVMKARFSANVVGALAIACARMAVPYNDDQEGGLFPEVYETEPDGLVVVTEETNLEAVPER